MEINNESAMTAICISEEICEALILSPESLLAQVVEDIRSQCGAVELRSKMVTLACVIEEALNTSDPDLPSALFEKVGCWDFEVIPALLAKLAETYGTGESGLNMFEADANAIRLLFTDLTA